MKLKVIAIVLLASIGYTSTLLAAACYGAGGTVVSKNITSTQQTGSISLSLGNSGGGSVFSLTGSLVGNISGTDGFGGTLLFHKAKFPKGNHFITSDDRAELVYPYVRATLEDGTPCSFWIRETISNIKGGTRFFEKVTSVEIVADGYISNCPNENENYFELSGELCVE